MSCNHPNYENLVRSGVVLAVGLPIALSLNGLVGTTNALLREAGQDKAAEYKSELRAELTEDCLKWAWTEVDSKLERGAKDGIDEVLGGQVNYPEVCKWVLK